MGLPRPLPPADVAAGSCTSPTWIGPQRAGEKCSEWDILVPKTGHKNVAAPARNSQASEEEVCPEKAGAVSFQKEMTREPLGD